MSKPISNKRNDSKTNQKVEKGEKGEESMYNKDKTRLTKRDRSTGKFLPGNKSAIGNKGGRPPKVYCIPDIIKELGDRIDPKTKQSYYNAMVTKAWQKAAAGDSVARAWISDRTEGTPTARVEHSGNLERVLNQTGYIGNTMLNGRIEVRTLEGKAGSEKTPLNGKLEAKKDTVYPYEINNISQYPPNIDNGQKDDEAL